MRTPLIAAVAAALAVASACSKESEPGPAAADEGKVQQAEARNTVPGPSGRPVEVSFEARDGAIIHGTLRPGPGPEAPLVILAHQLSKTRAEWKPVIEALSETPGLTTLAIDLRGHGASTATKSGQSLSWSAFDKDAWRLMENDVTAALDFVDKRGDLRPSRVVAVGSSIGGTAVLAAADTDPRVHAVVVLSPGRAYRGVDAMGPVGRLGERPLLVVAAEGEKPSADTARTMGQIATKAQVLVRPGAGHGLAMLADDPTLLATLVGFIRDPEAPIAGEAGAEATATSGP